MSIILSQPVERKYTAFEAAGSLYQFCRIPFGVTNGVANTLHHIEDMVNEIASYQVFSTLDLTSAYHQVTIKPVERKYTAFEAAGSLYQFCRIPFGVTNGVANTLHHIEDMVNEIASYQVFSTLDLTSAYHQVTIKPVERKYTAFEAAGSLYQFCRIPFGVTNGVANTLHHIEDMVNEIASYQVFSTLDLTSAYHQVTIKPVERKYTAFEAAGSLYQFCRIPFGVTNGVANTLHHIEDMVNEIASYQVFSTLDLTSAYHQVTIKPAERKYTAFEAAGSLYQFCRIPFGVTNGVANTLHHIEDMVNEIASYQVFSTLDLTSAYHQVTIKPVERKYTAFEAAGSLYQFCRIPFGVTNGVANFQRIQHHQARRPQRKPTPILTMLPSVEENRLNMTSI